MKEQKKRNLERHICELSDAFIHVYIYGIESIEA